MSATTPGRGVSRRELLKRAGVTGAAAVSLPAAVATTPAAAVIEREQRETFTAAQAETIEAVLGRLIPSDATGPGAAEAKVGRYIDKALNGELSSLQGFYAAGIAALDEYATSKYGAPFVSLVADQQDAILHDLEANTATGFSPSSSAFFETIREHAIEGMFCDPYHGGNANFVGWDLIHFPGIKLTVPAREQRLDVDVPPAHKSTTDYAIFKIGPGG
jgi:gluconate 2-dehydrogenase gamma chain